MTEVNYNNLPQMVANLFERFDRVEALLQTDRREKEVNPNERLT